MEAWHQGFLFNSKNITNMRIKHVDKLDSNALGFEIEHIGQGPSCKTIIVAPNNCLFLTLTTTLLPYRTPNIFRFGYVKFCPVNVQLFAFRTFHSEKGPPTLSARMKFGLSISLSGHSRTKTFTQTNSSQPYQCTILMRFPSSESFFSHCGNEW